MTDKVSIKETERQSNRAKLDGVVGLRDSMRKDIVETSLEFAIARSNRLMGAVNHLLEWGHQYTGLDGFGVFSDYARFCVPKGQMADLSHLKQVWMYWRNAPTMSQAFADGLITEAALRYAGANVDRIVLGDNTGSEIYVELEDADGEPMSRAEFIESQSARILELAQDLADADEPRKVDRGDIALLVETYAEGCVDTTTRRRSRAERAKRVATNAVVTIARDNGTLSLPTNKAGWREFERIAEKLAEKLDKVLVAGDELARQEQLAREAKEAIQAVDLLGAIAAQGAIPRNADETTVAMLAGIVLQAAPVLKAHTDGDLVLGQVLPSRHSPNGKAKHAPALTAQLQS